MRAILHVQIKFKAEMHCYASSLMWVSTSDGVSRLCLGLEGYRSRDFEYCEEIV